MITSVRFFTAWVTGRIRNERAGSLVEYALLLGLIAIVVIAAVTTFGQNTSSKLSAVASSVAG